MNVKLTKGRAATPADIETLEHAIDGALPASFFDFLRQHDGAEPETNIFKIGTTTNESGVNGFIPVRQIPAERENIENLPSNAFPVAWAEGGNYVFIDLAAEGAVFFWDHELPSSFVRLAENFAAFINMLEPFDVSSIKLQPGQVKSAWIDPDVLKGLDQ